MAMHSLTVRFHRGLSTWPEGTVSSGRKRTLMRRCVSRANLQKFSNTEMCRITELLIFQEPYQPGAEKNRWTSPQLDDAVAALQASAAVRRGLAYLRVRYQDDAASTAAVLRCCDVWIYDIRVFLQSIWNSRSIVGSTCHHMYGAYSSVFVCCFDTLFWTRHTVCSVRRSSSWSRRRRCCTGTCTPAAS